jgi:tRNA U34 5-carboxymethylaminomethyl modifying GTPase MnmE/TrmE
MKMKVVYPKFKNGEATVRNVKVKPNYGMNYLISELLHQVTEKLKMILCLLDYVEEIFNTFVDAKLNKKLKAARKELETMAPAPMNTMLEKQPRKEATEAWRKRKSMVVQEVPRTLQGTVQFVLRYS